jgi:O-antigen/teichoic acid export membrane protein
MTTALRGLARRAAVSGLVRSGALVFIGIILGNAVNYAYLLLLGRTLSVLDYGAVMSLIAAILLSHCIAGTLQTVTAKLAADLRAAGDEQPMATFSRAISRISLWIAAVTTLGAVALQRPVADYLHLDRPALVAVAGLVAGVGFAIIFQRGCFQGFGSFRAFTVSSLLDGVRTVLVVPFTLALGAMGSMLALAGGIVVTAAYGEFVLFRRFGRASVAAHLDLRRMLITAGATGSGSLGITVLMFYDVVLARHFLSPFQAGLYGAASLIGRVVFTVISFLPTVLLPYIAVRSARGGSATTILYAAIAIAAIVIVPIGVFAAFEPGLVIRILAGGRFEPGASLVLPYVVASGALALANVLATYSIGRHRFGFAAYLSATAVAEICAVVVRHGSAQQIVEDIVAGHCAVCFVMTAWIVFQLIGERAVRVEKDEPNGAAA